MRTRALAPLFLVSALLLPAATAAAQDRPPTMQVKTGKTVVRATQGSFCWMSGSGGMCADMAYPLPTQGALPYRARAPFVIGTSSPMDTLSVCLADERDQPLGVCLAVVRGADTKWRGTLPKNLRGAKRLGIFVTAAQGDSHYVAALAR